MACTTFTDAVTSGCTSSHVAPNRWRFEGPCLPACPSCAKMRHPHSLAHRLENPPGITPLSTHLSVIHIWCPLPLRCLLFATCHLSRILQAMTCIGHAYNLLTDETKSYFICSSPVSLSPSPSHRLSRSISSVYCQYLMSTFGECLFF